MGEEVLAESRSTVGKELTLHASSFVLGELEHPNKMPFSGVLTYFDSPSDKAPNGSGGRKVFIPSNVGLTSLSSLEGMAVNYVAGSMNGHNPTEKIGVITSAYTAEAQGDGAVPVFVEGYIYAHDFEDAATAIKLYQEHLGFSYETAKTRLMDGMFEGESVAVVTDLGYFTGASILWKDSAAYQTTSIAASAEEEKEDNEMELEKILAAIEGVKTYVDEKFATIQAQAEQKEAESKEEKEDVEDVEDVEEVVEESKSEDEIKAEGDEKDATTPDQEVDESKVDEDSHVEEVVEQQPNVEQTEINASALQAELDLVKKELADLKAEASLQASQRKSVAFPMTLMAKYDVSEQDEEGKLMASIDAREDLTIEQRFALKLEAMAKRNKQ